jgi:zinc transport system substrate-binding protein
MKNMIRPNILRAMCIFMLGWGMSLSGFGFKIAPRQKIKIMATVFPIMEFAREIVGDRGEVRLLLPPGAEVHTWQPRVSDIGKLAASDLFIYIGGGLEPWLEDIFKSAGRPGMKRIEASRGLGLISEGKHDSHAGHSAETSDPHIWLDFAFDQMIIDKIQLVLSDIDPAAAADYERSAQAYKVKLRRLDRLYEEALQNCRTRTFIFGGHSAFGYLARRYHLRQISVYGLSPDAAPTPKRLVDIITLAKAQGIKTVFFEPSVSDKMAKLVAKEIGADVLLLNPGHNLTTDQLATGMTFLRLMEINLESFKHGLACR